MGKALGIQAKGFEFDSLHLEKLGVSGPILNPGDPMMRWDTQAGGSPEASLVYTEQGAVSHMRWKVRTHH